VNFAPTWDIDWKKDAGKIYKVISSNYPQALKNFILGPYFIWFKIIFWPFIAI
jgi:hypothetical protein